MRGMVNLLRTFSNLLPTAVDTLKDARSEVWQSAVAGFGESYVESMPRGVKTQL